MLNWFIILFYCIFTDILVILVFVLRIFAVTKLRILKQPDNVLLYRSELDTSIESQIAALKSQLNSKDNKNHHGNENIQHGRRISIFFF